MLAPNDVGHLMGPRVPCVEIDRGQKAGAASPVQDDNLVIDVAGSGRAVGQMLMDPDKVVDPGLQTVGARPYCLLEIVLCIDERISFGRQHKGICEKFVLGSV